MASAIGANTSMLSSALSSAFSSLLCPCLTRGDAIPPPLAAEGVDGRDFEESERGERRGGEEGERVWMAIK